MAAAAACLWAQRPEAPPVPAARSADVYAVYSAALTRPILQHADTSRKFLIADTTGGAGEGRPDWCLNLPEARRAAVSEIMADHAAFTDRYFRLERNLTIPKPYELLNPAEAASFMDPRRVPPDPELARRIAGATDLITLGNVYFNRARTVAVVRIWNWCGRTCGSSAWRAFEKTDGRWAERDWIRCTAVAAL